MGSLAVSLAVSSSSSSGIGLRRSTGRDSGEDDILVGLLVDAGVACEGEACGFKASSWWCATGFDRFSCDGS